MRVAVADAMRRSWTRPLATVGRPVSIEAMLAHRKNSPPNPAPLCTRFAHLQSHSPKTARRPAGSSAKRSSTRRPSTSASPWKRGWRARAGAAQRGRASRSRHCCRATTNSSNSPASAAFLPSAQGGCIATVTNFGTFGLDWATPIPLPEQTLVLGLGAGRPMPYWDAEKSQFVPVAESDLTLSFDHRVLDGGAAGRLLAGIVELLQKPETL